MLISGKWFIVHRWERVRTKKMRKAECKCYANKKAREIKRGGMITLPHSCWQAAMCSVWAGLRRIAKQGPWMPASEFSVLLFYFSSPLCEYLWPLPGSLARKEGNIPLTSMIASYRQTLLRFIFAFFITGRDLLAWKAAASHWPWCYQGIWHLSRH